MDDKGIIGGVVILLLAVGAILFAVSGGNPTGTTALATPAGAQELAQCLKDSGTTFYGAFWCPHCKKQKGEFGAAVDALPYVECSEADGETQTAICKEKKIEGYPTWEFKNGKRVTGEQTFEKLAAMSRCPLNGVVPPEIVDDASTTPAATQVKHVEPLPPGLQGLGEPNKSAK